MRTIRRESGYDKSFEKVLRRGKVMQKLHDIVRHIAEQGRAES